MVYPNGHPIDVDLEKILPILANQIYTSPFAFLRENVQNAFDAVRIQMYRDRLLGVPKDHEIDISLHDTRVSISDTGIGMTEKELKEFFWSIGKSGKNNDEAKLAGVVGTFGIGGMANFGVCSRLEVKSRKYTSNNAVTCWAERSQLSATEHCVFYEDSTQDSPGTIVTGTLLNSVTSTEVEEYLSPITKYLDVPIKINGKIISGKPFPKLKSSSDNPSVTIQHGDVTVSLILQVAKNGKAAAEILSLEYQGVKTSIRAVFRTNNDVIAAYQHGFMLANVPINSMFGLGGCIDCELLRPTAGREAVTDYSRTFVQKIIYSVEKALVEYIASKPDLPQHFNAFYRYLCQKQNWGLANESTIRVFGAQQRVPLKSLKGLDIATVFYANENHDKAIMQAYQEKGRTVALLSTNTYRRKVEVGFLEKFCHAKQLDDCVTCLKVVEDLGANALGVKYKLRSKLQQQYLIDNLNIQVGELTHEAIVWVPQKKHNSRITLYIDLRHSYVMRLIDLQYSLSIDALYDVFIRDHVLPHLEIAFPELRKRDFDKMLKKLQSSFEYYEVDPTDVRRLNYLAETTKMAPEKIAEVLGTRRRGRPVPSSVERSEVARISDVVNQCNEDITRQEIEELETNLESLKSNMVERATKYREAFAFRLLQIKTSNVKVFDATDVDPVLGFSQYYFALTQDAHVLYRRIFLERLPSTDFSWGGHRAGYLFYCEGLSVVYYDIQFERLIEFNDLSQSRSATIAIPNHPLITKDMVYLPIPDCFGEFMVPKDKTLKFSIQHQIMGINEISDG